MSIVSVVGRVLDMGSRNGDTTLALLGSLVNGAILEEVGKALLGLTLGDGGSQGGLDEAGQIRMSGMKGEGALTFP